MSNIDWHQQLIVPVRESTEAQFKHLMVKTALTFAIKMRYKKSLFYQRIYPECPLKGAITDVYHEDRKNSAVYCYEIQKDITPEWTKSRNEFYSKLEVCGFKTVEWILINLNKCPDSLEEIRKWVEEQII